MTNATATKQDVINAHNELFCINSRNRKQSNIWEIKEHLDYLGLSYTDELILTAHPKLRAISTSRTFDCIPPSAEAKLIPGMNETLAYMEEVSPI